MKKTHNKIKKSLITFLILLLVFSAWLIKTIITPDRLGASSSTDEYNDINPQYSITTVRNKPVLSFLADPFKEEYLMVEAKQVEGKKSAFVVEVYGDNNKLLKKINNLTSPVFIRFKGGTDTFKVVYKGDQNTKFFTNILWGKEQIERSTAYRKFFKEYETVNTR